MDEAERRQERARIEAEIRGLRERQRGLRAYLSTAKESLQQGYINEIAGLEGEITSA